MQILRLSLEESLSITTGRGGGCGVGGGIGV
jgi:hypothetical protein